MPQFINIGYEPADIGYGYLLPLQGNVPRISVAKLETDVLYPVRYEPFSGGKIKTIRKGV